MPAEAASALFQVVNQRYLKSSIIMTTNRSVTSWGEVLGDTTVAAALLDRLLHRSVVIDISGDSYRLRDHHARTDNIRRALRTRTARAKDTTMTSVRNDTETTTTSVCPQCGTSFTPVGRRRWCSDACRQSAWRRRRAAPRPTQPAKIDTVYECPQCQTRYLGTQRCEDCNTWCRRLGPGGPCPHCDDLVAVKTSSPTTNTARRPTQAAKSPRRTPPHRLKLTPPPSGEVR